jgi:hypothetical protein
MMHSRLQIVPSSNSIVSGPMDSSSAAAKRSRATGVRESKREPSIPSWLPLRMFSWQSAQPGGRAPEPIESRSIARPMPDHASATVFLG